MWLYQILDILLTLEEMLLLYIFSIYLCKEPRFRTPIWRVVPMCALFVVIWILTWFTKLGAYKIPVILITSIILMKICYRDSIYQIITVNEISFTVTNILPESIGVFLTQWVYGEELIIPVDGMMILRWESYMVTFLIRIFMGWGMCRILKNFQFRIQFKDCLVMTASFLIVFGVYILSCFDYLNLSEDSELISYVRDTFISMVFLVTFLYSKNTLYLKNQVEREKMQIFQMQQQFAYYQEKLKDEERVCSLYHDMKNHLLVLKQQTGSAETGELIEKLQQEVAVYEDYIHTGSDILDIILKEKARLDREKNILFSITAN